MKCPFCGDQESKVVDSRHSEDGLSIRRRRECIACQRRFTTYEYVETVALTVIKRDNRREPFQRDKLLNGILTSCKKRPVSMDTINEIVDSVENELFALESQEVSYRRASRKSR